MAIAEKLYPPTIASSIPAFYGTTNVKLVVPFSMNRAVSKEEVVGFALKIKTAQSNNYITTLEVTGEAVETALNENKVTFTWNQVEKIVTGQYIKVQLAYMKKEEETSIYTTGYFSTVATAKYTTKPTVEILNMNNYDPSSDNPKIAAFQQTYTGSYKIAENGDKSERPYSYCFSLYNQADGLVESSGWKLHNATLNTIASETLQLEETTDTYTFQSSLRRNTTYYIQYSVRTINDLEVSSFMYPVIEATTQATGKEIQLIAENIFEEGYINLSLNVDITKNYIFALRDKILKYYNATSIEQDDNNYIVKNGDDVITTLIGIDNYITQSNSISIVVERAEVGYFEDPEHANINEDLYNWKPIKKAHFRNYTDVLDWNFKDFTIEQGITYCYAFKQYNDNQVFSNREFSNIVEADFEDMFLWDGQKQLKIRFNPKVSSFKITRQEQKIDTIGNKYPYFFRNGVVNYKEFPISGLISYLADNNEMFVNHKEDLNIILPQYSEREGTPSNKLDYKRVATLDSIGYNMRAERRFKMKLLEWLNDGQIKLFRSPAEGNFLVRLMNVSLTPEDRLGRMIHSFQASAFEVAELNYESLVQEDFVKLEEEEITTTRSITTKIGDILTSQYDPSDGTGGTRLFKLNTYPIKNKFSIYGVTHPFYVKIGGTSATNRHYITQVGFTVENLGENLSDIYIDRSDNVSKSNITGEASGQSGTGFYALLGDIRDALLYYEYSSTDIETGEIEQDNRVVDETYVTTETETKVGSINNNENIIPAIVEIQDSNDKVVEIVEVLQYFKIQCCLKQTKELYFLNNKYYIKNNNNSIGTEVSFSKFNTIELYKIYDDENDLTSYYYQMLDETSNEFVEIEENNIDYIIYIDNEPINTSFDKQFHINPINIQTITLGNATYINYARQVKITKFKQGE